MKDPISNAENNNTDQIKPKITIESFSVDETNVNVNINPNTIRNNENAIKNNFGSNASNSSSDPLQNIKNFLKSEKFKNLVCPFKDSSEGCKICYKIFAALTCLVILSVIFLIISYK
jgi:hypothetical protein